MALPLISLPTIVASVFMVSNQMPGPALSRTALLRKSRPCVSMNFVAPASQVQSNPSTPLDSIWHPDTTMGRSSASWCQPMTPICPLPSAQQPWTSVPDPRRMPAPWLSTARTATSVQSWVSAALMAPCWAQTA